MKILFFLLAISIFANTYSWNATKELPRRCQEPTPDWMAERIEKDLSYFSKNEINLAKTMDLISSEPEGNLAELVILHIQEGKIDYITHFSLSEKSKERLNTMIQALGLLHELVPLPNVELIVSLADRYDRPYFSLLTKAPVFTVSKEKSFAKSVLFPSALWQSNREDLFAAVADAATQIPWHQREKTAFWRGSSSEAYDLLNWDFGMRPRLVYCSRANPGIVNAALIDNHYLDTFSREWQQWIRSQGFTKPFVSPENQLSYRYLIAIDGNAVPTSLSWQLFSGSTLCKAETSCIEWFYDALKPNVHYLPIACHSTNLVEKICFLQENDSLALQIAENAAAFAKEWLTDDSAFLYTYKLLQAYAALVSAKGH